MKKQDYQLLIFDWDGTLMDSEARIVACLQAASADLGLEVPDKERAKNVIGLGLYEAVHKLFPEGEHDLHLKLSDRYRYHFLTADPTPSQLFQGARQMLEDLRQAGYWLAIATGKGRAGLNKVLQETDLGELFLATRCADETASKPNPQMLHELLDEFGLEAEQAIMIGDTEYDMEMALHARMDRLAVSYGVHELERLLKHQPVETMESIPEMHSWLVEID
jgi:phosphoglycolate phosphatase